MALTTTLAKQLSKQKTRLIIFDDVQHIAEYMRPSNQHAASELFKVIAKIAKTEVALVGMPSAKNVVSGSKQLMAMLEQVYEIKPYPFPEDENAPFMEFLKDMQSCLPFDMECDIANINVGGRLYKYSGGRPGVVQLLLQLATKYAVANKSMFIDETTLFLVVRDLQNVSAALNPFIPSDMTSVNATGGLYARS